MRCDAMMRVGVDADRLEAPGIRAITRGLSLGTITSSPSSPGVAAPLNERQQGPSRPDPFLPRA
jgi:hypothetical protein